MDLEYIYSKFVFFSVARTAHKMILELKVNWPREQIHFCGYPERNTEVDGFAIIVCGAFIYTVSICL